MKKPLLFTILTIASLSVFAQIKNTGKKDATITLKPGAEIKFQPVADTLHHLQSYKDLQVRMIAISNLIFLSTQPGDVTPNQKNSLLRTADSLLRIDNSLWQKNEALKKKGG